MRQLTRHNLGYRLNPFPHSVISNLAFVACRSSVFDVRGRACSGCPVRHPANPSASPSTAVLHGDSACVGRSSTRCDAGSSVRPRCGNPRVKRLNSALWWPTPHCSRRSRSIPERFPIDSASLARQTQFGVHIRPKTVEIRGDSAVSGRVRSCCRALKLSTMLMGVSGPIVQILRLPVFHRGHQHVVGRPGSRRACR
jgi:hypothetical protein